jgi:hypothetical protein
MNMEMYVELSLPSAPSGFLLGFLFEPEDGGDMFLRNVGLPPNTQTVLTAQNTALFIVTSVRTSNPA